MDRRFLIVSLTLVLLVGAGSGVYFYLSGRTAPESEQVPEEEVSLYFVHRRDNKLDIVRRTLSPTESQSRRVRQVLGELTNSPAGDTLTAVVPEDLEVNSVFLRDQTVVLDLNDALIGAAEGTTGEMLLLYSMVNSVLDNLPEKYKLVQFLIDGEMRKTIGAYGEESGHIAIMYPLGPRWESLVR